LDTSKLPVYKYRYHLLAHWLLEVGGTGVGFSIFGVVGALKQVLGYRTAFIVLIESQLLYQQITGYLKEQNIMFYTTLDVDIVAITIYQQERN
jgi:hypothetical protein